MSSTINNTEIREKLATLEHEQWLRWTNYLLTNYELPKEIVDKWKESWKPYLDLTEAQKDKDRVWADKVLKLFDSLLTNKIKEIEKEQKRHMDIFDKNFKNKKVVFKKEAVRKMLEVTFEEILKTLQEK